MTHAVNSSSERSRISLEVEHSFHRRLQLAAAVRDQTVGQYVLEAVEVRLRQENEEGSDANIVMAASDPVLAELWDNPRDAEYDRL